MRSAKTPFAWSGRADWPAMPQVRSHMPLLAASPVIAVTIPAHWSTQTALRSCSSGLTPAIPWLSVRTRVETARLSLAVGRPEAALDLCDEILSVLRTCPTLDSRPTSELKLQALFGSKGDPWAATLSRAELRVLPLLASHLTFAEMAEKLFVSRNTVKSQAISIYRKLGVSTRNEAVMRAAELGLMSSSFTDAGTHSNGHRPSAHAAR